MSTKGSYSYSFIPCFSNTACFSNPLFCIAPLLYDSGVLPTDKDNYSLDPLKRGEEEYDAHCMTGANSSAPLFLMYKPTVVHSPDILLMLLATLALRDYRAPAVYRQTALTVPTLPFLAIISLSCADTHKHPCILLYWILAAIHCIPWVLWVLYCTSSHAACVEMQKSLCTSSHSWGERIPCSTDNITQVQSQNDNWRKGYREESGVFFDQMFHGCEVWECFH